MVQLGPVNVQCPCGTYLAIKVEAEIVQEDGQYTLKCTPDMNEVRGHMKEHEQ